MRRAVVLRYRCRRAGSTRQQPAGVAATAGPVPASYTVEDAHEFIAGARSATPATAFAVTVGDVPVGAIGVRLRDDVERCSAVPFASNIASCRVLEKAGYVLEGRMRRSAIKAGVVQDQLSYAVLRGDEDR
mgnify:CR=1 FL=1